MAYISYPSQSFGGGLNLRDKADSVDAAECVDALNVTFSDRGAIEQRAGYGEFTASALTNRVDSLFAADTASGTRQLIAGCGTRLEALNTSGEVISSATGLTGGPWGFAEIGTPNSTTVYAGNGTDTIRQWDGSSWTAPTATVGGEASKAMPKGRFLAAQSPDNRLVITGFSTTTGGPNGGTSSPSHVYFSDAGDPTSWEANNFVQLTPGDGEAIQGVIAWGEFIFVFKESKFFVFYGNETDSEGFPIFSYRPVDTGIGLASPRTLCADKSGVYFMSRTGVYRTTGQEPQLISSPVDPIWSADTSPFYSGGALAQASITNCAAAVHDQRLYLSFPTESANNRTLVYDPQFEWWSLYDLPCAALTSFRSGTRAELFFGYATGTNDIGQHGPVFSNDNEAAITSRWRSGWFDLESPDVKTIRSSKFWGTGEVFCGLGADFAQDNGDLVSLNFHSLDSARYEESHYEVDHYAQPIGLLHAYRRKASRGTAFSLYLTNSILDKDWSLHRADHHLRETRKPSTALA